MENKLSTIILIPIFIILLVVIFRTTKESFKLNWPASLVISTCASILATIALNSNLPGTIGTILIPYKALGICILVIVLIAFLSKVHKKVKDCFSSGHKEISRSEINEKRIKE